MGSNADDPSVSWPPSGGTDLMEIIGYPDWTGTAFLRRDRPFDAPSASVAHPGPG
ncbi:hypothetical protein ACIBJF_18590 [Streptomyces sp. NPDC050743]|uniref:hypothetical protein n=1 Tax=Streptomyces sp. NPDC050743 TaxID=3365634 RepID=UPI0037A4FF17